MNAQRERCIDELADARVDALLYACLVAIMAQGPGEHRRTEDAVTAQLANAGQRPAVLSSAGALVEALAALGATRITLVMPYLRPLAEQVVIPEGAGRCQGMVDLRFSRWWTVCRAC